MSIEPAQLWARLPANERAALTTTSRWVGIKHLALHSLAIVAFATYVAMGLALWGIALLPLGLCLAFLFTLQHECTHKTPFATRWMNEWVGHITGLILIQPFGWFRAFHMAHHRYTNDPDRDPELTGDAKPKNLRGMIWHVSSLGYWTAKASTLWANANGRCDSSYVSGRAIPRLITEARAMLVIYTLALGFTLFISPILLWIWIIPLCLGFPALRLYLLAEHGRCPQVANMFLNSRTTLTTTLVRWLAWNMPYHAEHHAYPTVPFDKLPDVHKITKDHIETLTDGYVSFAKSYLNGTEGGAP